MPKSKAAQVSGSESASEAEGPSTSSKKRQLDSSDEPVTKKAKTETELGSTEGERKKSKILVTSSGEKYIELGKKKRATVREFKGTIFLDIREYYGADDQEKPGKKGISLTLEQWEVLRESASTIDQFFSTQKKK